MITSRRMKKKTVKLETNERLNQDLIVTRTIEVQKEALSYDLNTGVLLQGATKA